MNEYVHDATDQDILGLVVECTGGEKNSATTKYTMSTINALRRISDFDIDTEVEKLSEFNESSGIGANTIQASLAAIPQIQSNINHQNDKKMNLSYTINLNLPATKDIEVFNAIFKSLKEHLLGN